jgi:hypothetical protein
MSKAEYNKNSCTPIVVARLFTEVKPWNQSTSDERIKMHVNGLHQMKG